MYDYICGKFGWMDKIKRDWGYWSSKCCRGVLYFIRRIIDGKREKRGEIWVRFVIYIVVCCFGYIV